MAAKVVNVTLDGVQLHLDHADLLVGDGDTVQWNFPEVPNHCWPFIFFPKQANQPFSPLGPFKSLKPTLSGTLGGVLGAGNSGVQQEYPYTAMILNQDGAVAMSTSPARIFNTASRNTSPVAIVRYRNDQPETERIDVDPDMLQVAAGQTVQWHLIGIPENHFVTFHFNGFADPMQGPFSSFTVDRTFDSNQIAIGADFLIAPDPQGSLSPIQYFVRLRNAMGTVIDSDDPVIEPLESPPHGG